MRALAGRGRGARRRARCTRTRRRSTATSPSRCLDVVESVGLAAPAAGLGPGQLRPVRGPAVHRGLRRCCARTWSTSRSRTRWPADGTVRARRRRATGRSGRRIRAPAATTGSTGSSRWSRTWVGRASLGGFSGAELFAPGATRAFTELLRAEGIELPMTDEHHQRTPVAAAFAIVGAGSSARTHGLVDHPARGPLELAAVVDLARRPGRAARRRARRRLYDVPRPRRCATRTSTPSRSARRAASTRSWRSRRSRPGKHVMVEKPARRERPSRQADEVSRAPAEAGTHRHGDLPAPLRPATSLASPAIREGRARAG